MASPLTFTGVDPNSQRTGLQARQDLEKTLGAPLTDAQLEQAYGVVGPMGYTDRSGGAMMSGAQYNALLKEAAKQTGGTFADWSQPGAQAPAAPPALTFQNPAAPEYQAPELQQPDPYQAPDPFQYDAWRGTTADDLTVDPGYQFRLEEGRKALEASAAARGLLRTGGTMKDLLNYGQEAASQEFSNVDARRRADYQTGYTTASDIYDRNANTGRYGYEQSVDAAQRQYDAATLNAQSEYAPRLASWQAARDDANRAAELNFDRDYQKDLYAKDDAFRRERATVDDRYRDRTYDTDDAYRRWLAELQNRQFLAELGTRQ